MRPVVAAVWCLLLLGAGGAAAVGTGTTGPAAATPEANATPSGDANASTLGAEISAFVSRTDAETVGTVEREVSTARLNRSNDSDAVRNRVNDLAVRYERLRAAWTALERARANGSIPPMAYHARRAALAARTESLGDSVTAVRPAARRTGVETETLDALDERLPAAETGPAAPVADSDRGPPDGALPPLAANDTPAAVGTPPNGTGPADPPSRSNATAPGGGSIDPPNASERAASDRPVSGPSSGGNSSTAADPPASPSPPSSSPGTATPKLGPPSTSTSTSAPETPDSSETPSPPDERPSTAVESEGSGRPSTNATVPGGGGPETD